MFNSLLNFIRRHIILFGATKFIVGLLLGFALGVYTLPILVAEEGLDATALAQLQAQAERSGEFRRDLEGSDFGHWGEGTVRVSQDRIWLEGRVSPGPDYRLYLTPKFVETGRDFNSIKSRSIQVGRIKSFKNFSIPVDASVNVNNYPALIIWCERFGQFITSARLN